MPMRKSRFTEKQLAHALRQAETGTPVTGGVSGDGGDPADLLSLEEARRLRLLDEETADSSNWWRISRSTS
jgi:hypothetical protein